MDYNELKSKWGRKPGGNNSNTKLIAGSIVVLIILAASFFYFTAAQRIPNIQVTARIADFVVLSENCTSGKTVGVLYNADVKVDDKPLASADVKLRPYNSAGTELYTLLFGPGYDYPISMTRNSTSGVWYLAQVYSCAPLGTYYGKVDVTAKVNNILLNASTNTDNFVIQ